MTVKGGTSQACAACKYQRRKCSSDCALAPFFPPDQPKMFQNAHRLFGVRNILNILKQLNPIQKTDAMRSIILQSTIRDRYPVHGCHGVIVQLQYQIQQTYLELEAVNAQLAIYRQQHHHHQQQSPPPPPPHHHHSPSSQLQLGTTSPNNALTLFQDHPHQQFINPMVLSNENNSIYDTNGYVVDAKDNIMSPLWVQHPYNNNNNTNPVTIQSQFVPSLQAFSLQHDQIEEGSQDYNDIPSFFDTIDDRQSYIDSKEAYESSSESSLKDTTQSIENISENELKSAAACFNLAGVN